MKKILILAFILASQSVFAREVPVAGSSMKDCAAAQQDAASSAPSSCAEWETYIEVRHDSNGCSTMKVECGDGYQSTECTKYIMSSKAICRGERG